MHLTKTLNIICIYYFFIFDPSNLIFLLLYKFWIYHATFQLFLKEERAMSESHTLLEESDSKDIKKLVKGLTGAFGLVFGIVGGLACVILMNQIAPDFQLNSLRFIIGLTFSITSLIITRKLPKIDKKNVKWQIVVAFFNLSLNLGGYSHYLKVITFTGTRSLQIGWESYLH